MTGTDLPAVCGLGWQDVRKKHLSELPEVEELISATAKCHVQVRTIFIQSSLLEKLCVLHYKGGKERGFFTQGTHRQDSVDYAGEPHLSVWLC